MGKEGRRFLPNLKKLGSPRLNFDESPLRSVVLYIQDNNSTKELLRVGEIYSEKVYKDKIKTIKYATKKIKKYMKMLSKLKNEMITEDSF